MLPFVLGLVLTIPVVLNRTKAELRPPAKRNQSHPRATGLNRFAKRDDLRRLILTFPQRLFAPRSNVAVVTLRQD